RHTRSDRDWSSDVCSSDLELQFDDELKGRPGWTTLIRDGRGRSHALDRGMKRAPEDGHHLVTTLDADLQAIVESHLARAVDTLKIGRASCRERRDASGVGV